MGLADIEKREDSKTIIAYHKRKGLIKKQNEGRKASLMLKGRDLEGITIE